MHSHDNDSKLNLNQDVTYEDSQEVMKHNYTITELDKSGKRIIFNSNL